MLECSSLDVDRETFETMIAVGYCGGLCRVILRCKRESENHFMWNIFIMEHSDMQPVHNICSSNSVLLGLCLVIALGEPYTLGFSRVPYFSSLFSL